MKSIALVSLNCETGLVNRYLRGAGNKPERTGDAQFAAWNPADMTIDWSKVWNYLQAFRIGYIPPEDPSPHPTSPLRTAQRRAA